jgi:hypothetical protein
LENGSVTAATNTTMKMEFGPMKMDKQAKLNCKFMLMIADPDTIQRATRWEDTANDTIT